jgi:hypothetical protein
MNPNEAQTGWQSPNSFRRRHQRDDETQHRRYLQGRIGPFFATVKKAEMENRKFCLEVQHLRVRGMRLSFYPQGLGKNKGVAVTCLCSE